MVTLAPEGLRDELLATFAHRHARLYRIARRDGVVIRLTEHSAPIEFDGEQYLPTQSANASAAISRAGLAETSLDTQGAITSDLITEADLRAGRYRGAEVLEILVDFRFPFLGALEVNRTWVEATKQDGAIWQAQCGGIGSRLKRKVGRYLEKSCWKVLGDPLTCKLDIVPLSNYYAPISHVLDPRSFRVQDLGNTRPLGWFAYGSAIFRSGPNDGIELLIQSYDNANQLIVLAQQPPFALQVGHRVDLIVGCNRTQAKCNSLGNYINFGGLPFLPTTDEQIKPATN
jgi:uncharacterized phage protein (TIGR02218 family)